VQSLGALALQAAHRHCTPRCRCARWDPLAEIDHLDQHNDAPCPPFTSHGASIAHPRLTISGSDWLPGPPIHAARPPHRSVKFALVKDRDLARRQLLEAHAAAAPPPAAVVVYRGSDGLNVSLAPVRATMCSGTLSY
jgi:hypothetical protein